MKIVLFVIVGLIVLVGVGATMYLRSLGGVQSVRAADVPSLYDLSTRTLDGAPVDLATYRGRVALVVNTASKCGLTPQYEGLEALHRELAPRGFVILGFPSNDFMGQEPGSAEEIRSFCSTRFDVTFPLFEKSVVKGEGKSEVYARLCVELDEPDWNFTKYLVDREGRVVARFGPRVKPDDPELRARIEVLLGEV